MASVKFRKPTDEEKGKIGNAAIYGDLPTIQQLASSGVDVTGIVHDEYNRTALHIAAMYGYSEVIDYLIKRGAEVDAVDNDNWTALHYAADGGHSEVVDYLCTEGASIDAVDKDNMTPLEWAVSFGHSDTVYYFINTLKMDITKFDEGTQVKINKLMKDAKQR